MTAKRAFALFTLAFAVLTYAVPVAEAHEARHSHYHGRIYHRGWGHHQPSYPHNPPYRPYGDPREAEGMQVTEYGWSREGAEAFLRNLDEIEQAAAERSSRVWRPNYRHAQRSSQWCDRYQWDDGEVSSLQREIRSMTAYLEWEAEEWEEEEDDFYLWSPEEVERLHRRLRKIRRDMHRLGWEMGWEYHHR